jgi:hypothetical protein
MNTGIAGKILDLMYEKWYNGWSDLYPLKGMILFFNGNFNRLKEFLLREVLSL